MKKINIRLLLFIILLVLLIIIIATGINRYRTVHSRFYSNLQGTYEMELDSSYVYRNCDVIPDGFIVQIHKDNISLPIFKSENSDTNATVTYQDIVKIEEERNGTWEIISSNPDSIFIEAEGHILHGKYHSVAEEDPDYAEGMGLTYKEELEALHLKYRKLEQEHESHIRHLEGEHQYELNRLREQLEEKALNKRRQYDADAHLYTFSEMSEIVKARFSKAGAEEFSNMLYKLASKHGYLNEDTSRAIDYIVAAVIEREKGVTAVNIPSVNQVNINPKQVTNTYIDDKKE